MYDQRTFVYDGCHKQVPYETRMASKLFLMYVISCLIMSRGHNTLILSYEVIKTSVSFHRMPADIGSVTAEGDLMSRLILPFIPKTTIMVTINNSCYFWEHCSNPDSS